MEIHNDSTVDGPPITKLNRDLLWQIFALNADIDAGPQGVVNISDTDDLFLLSPLTTARHTSQVCVSWRQLIIGSPSLWGNMIDLESLQQRSDTWRNEVLLRTGDSELSIKGNILWDTKNITEFLVLLLKNHWTRINRIHVGIYNSGKRDWPLDAWSALGCPAPRLRSCSILFEYDLPYAYSSPGFSLFANDAPLLTHFQQHRAPMNFGASWLANLTSLTLNSPTTLGSVLDVCSRMHSIQTLRLMFGNNTPSITGQLRSVNLPLLTALDITCPVEASMIFLDHITPAPGCNLHLFTNAEKVPLTPTEIVSAQRIIAKFATNYFSHRGSTSFFLHCTSKFMSAGDISPDSHYPRDEGFTIFVYNFHGLPIPLFTLCFGTFVPAHFSRVKTLNLHFDGVDPTAHPLDPLFANYLAKMTALETLVLTTASLIFIDALAEVRSPRLKTLAWLPKPIDSPDKTSLIMDFLATRRKIGMPIEILDLTQWYMLSNVPMDIKKLEEEPGLRVVWLERPEGDRREYVCGSGRPEELTLPMSLATN